MKTLQMENVCLDVWLEVTKKLDTKSVYNLMLSSLSMYNMYRCNECHFQYILLKKSLDELGVNEIIIKKILELYTTLSFSTKSELCKFIQKMNRYFQPHLDSSVSEMLGFVVESNVSLDVATIIFELFTQKARLAKTSKLNSDIITYDDAAYLITHAHPSLIRFILWRGALPPDVIVDIITTDPVQNTHKTQELVNYFFVKHCMRRFYNQGVFELNRMLKYFIDTNQPQNLTYTLSLRDTYVRDTTQSIPINYNACINAAIRCDNLSILQLLFQDLHRASIASSQPIPVIISPNSIEAMMSQGRFDCLEYLVTEQLGDAFRMDVYARSILGGLLKMNKRMNIDWSKLDILNQVLKVSFLDDLKETIRITTERLSTHKKTNSKS